ncbi:P-loop NTPase fold protein [Methanobrevibacter olleyae]|uniref:KAP family P-loop protein n=1 Tax=Methanobrevibacter olleyae TaxID=294671 RepID=A0A126R0A0_METOL|nr:P-loop NTPase fold protein [Methanobrevibacter olleyae]AMK15494.1 KAP family P-loop protein [Methanobrevibacter olleyae]
MNDIKSSLKDILKDKKKIIIIIIDDIDRLNPNEVKQIFQLVKSLADFPNIIYILAFDKDYVNFALKDWNIDSEEYSHSEDFIDKIVQVPILIPKFDEEDLFNIFSSELDEILLNHKKSIDFNNKIIYDLIKPFLYNIRNINRFFNSLDFNLYAVEDINSFDFILITALQVFENDIYDEIKYNKDLLVGNFNILEKVNNLKSKNRINLKNFIEILLNSTKNDKKTVKLILSYLFPKVNWICFEKSINDKQINARTKENSVFNIEYFDLYFLFYMGDNILSNSRIKSILYSTNNKDEFKSNLFRLKELGSIIKLFNLFKYHKDEFSIDNTSNVIEVLLNNFEELFIGIYNNEDCDSICYSLLNFILDLSDLYNDKSIFKNIIKKVLLNSNDNYFKIFLIHNDNIRKFFDDDDLLELDNYILNYISDLCNNQNIKNISNLYNILRFWKFFAKKDEVNNYIKDLKDIDLVYLIKSLAYSNGNSLSFNIVILENFIDLKYVYSKSIKLKK